MEQLPATELKSPLTAIVDAQVMIIPDGGHNIAFQARSIAGIRRPTLQSCLELCAEADVLLPGALILVGLGQLVQALLGVDHVTYVGWWW